LQFKKEKDKLFLTGDAFTKGPDPIGVWHQIVETGAEMVLGNHDDALLGRLLKRSKDQEDKHMNPNHKRTVDALMPVISDVISWIEKLPLFIETSKFLLVHAGINPEGELLATSRDEFLTIRTWPPIKGIEGKRWHHVYQPIRPLLVFGHDAPGGLVVKYNRNRIPYLIGLDSGCVYGNQLSAYILEEKRIVQIESYQPKLFSE
jgi:hypothetical protein